MQALDPIFVTASAITFGTGCLFFVLCHLLGGPSRDGERAHRLAVNALTLTFVFAIALPWALAAFGHSLLRVSHHISPPPSLNPWICVFYALVGELWFYMIWSSSEHAWLEAGMYCSFNSAIGAMLAMGLAWLPLVLLGPIFVLECVTITEDFRQGLAYRREQQRRERVRKKLSQLGE